MKGRRYSEGTKIPELKFPKHSDTVIENLRRERRTMYSVPKDAASKASSTSEARDCFVGRAFSRRLQNFMISYSYTLVTTKVLSGEI